MAFFLKWGAKLGIVGGATYLVANHEVFGTNRYTKQIIQEVRRALPDTAEAYDQMPSKNEVADAMVETWNSGAQTAFKTLADSPTHTCRFVSWLSEKISG